jgi:hypothetical protein
LAIADAVVNKNDWTMALILLGSAIGCGVILVIAGCKRSRHHRRIEESTRQEQRPACRNRSDITLFETATLDQPLRLPTDCAGARNEPGRSGTGATQSR